MIVKAIITEEVCNKLAYALNNNHNDVRRGNQALEEVIRLYGLKARDRRKEKREKAFFENIFGIKTGGTK